MPTARSAVFSSPPSAAPFFRFIRFSPSSLDFSCTRRAHRNPKTTRGNRYKRITPSRYRRFGFEVMASAVFRPYTRPVSNALVFRFYQYVYVLRNISIKFLGSGARKTFGSITGVYVCSVVKQKRV